MSVQTRHHGLQTFKSGSAEQVEVLRLIYISAKAVTKIEMRFRFHFDIKQNEKGHGDGRNRRSDLD